mmetsp:Transcript_61771/g.169969  ORF Transcript_61771/g.169969 Transcript_61771/m.169969 type:complete len:239 (-) Transcript_61771:228-944(-)
MQWIEASDLGTCPDCGYKYKRTARLPSSIPELTAATLSDTEVVGFSLNCLFYWLVLISFTSACEGYRIASVAEGEANGAGGAGVGSNGLDNGLSNGWDAGATVAVSRYPWPQPGGVVLAWFELQQMVLLHIFFSPRFEQVVVRLFRDRHRPGSAHGFYARLYVYFVAAVAFVLLTFTPALPMSMPGLFPTGQLPYWLSFIASLNVAVYAVVSTSVVFLFWKTNYRILTFAESDQDAAV